MTRISVRETYAGKHILVTGATGFVGKVWLAMMLDRVGEVGRIYVLMRGKGRSVEQRFEKIVNESMVFKPLHERHGANLSEFISSRVEVIAGDLSQPDLGIDTQTAQRLHGEVDLVVNCAGLVDFNPDVRDALSANVEGATRVADFVEACDHAALLHISTCYVAGQRDGVIPETLRRGESPNETPLQGRQEYDKLGELIAEVEAENEAPQTEAALRDDVLTRARDRGTEPDERRIGEMVKRLKRKRLREMMAQAGTDRARELGWPNTYTYTKALAELLLAERAGLRFAIFRPAIVESAIEFPFAGWNEGFNTSGPLVYLAGTWFRHIPARAGNPLDVIPVDQVCKAMFLVGAALIRGDHAPVYQCGSSDRNFLAIDRLTELSALGHRQHLRKKGEGKVEKLLLSRWDARASDPEHVLNVGNVRRAVAQVTRYLRHGRPDKIPSEVREWADDLANTGDNSQRKLRQIEDVLELFMPFTYDHYCVFECRAIDRHQPLEADFRFEPEAIEWRSYWLDVHMPGLRRWCFPKYENKESETYTPDVPFRLIPRATSSSTQDATGPAKNASRPIAAPVQKEAG